MPVDTSLDKQTTVPVIITCSVCAKQHATKPTPAGLPRTPRGWKKQAETYFCDICWKSKYVLRAISIPVVSPVDIPWEDLRKVLKIMWRETTRCANRIMTECYMRDVRRTDIDKMPLMPKIYLYPELRKEFPELPSQTVASLEQSCERKYRAMRRKIIWSASASLPTYRYPTPFPIPNQGWSCYITEDKPFVSVRLGDRRLDLRLKSGPQFRRQYEQFRLLAKGEAVKGEAAIYQTGGTKPALMVKLVAWLPRKAAQSGLTGTLKVRTDKESLLVALNTKDETLWRYNADHLRRWTAEHRKQLQRWAEDAKYEARPEPSFTDRRSASVLKFHNRLDSAIHQISMQLAGYAKRRRFLAVEYNDSEHGYVEQFPWFRLRVLIQEKLDAMGVAFVHTGPAEEPGEVEVSEEPSSE